MRKLSALIFFTCFFSGVKASHITGGEVYYVFKGMSNGQYQYNVTLKLLMRCNSGKQFNDPAIISFFEKSTNTRYKDVSVPLSRKETIQLTEFNRCINDPPTVCYEVGYYTFTISLPPSADGYIITGQFIYRISGINNLTFSNSIGATYTAEIPGNFAMPGAPANTSAQFVGSDLVAICAGSTFTYSFAATDADGDQLRYSFCDAFQGGVSSNANTDNPPAAPPYQPVPYTAPYSGSVPLGGKVSIDPNTGIVTGTAPSDAGIYVLTVCVSEVRNGVVIATQRKDIQINIASCTIAGARLQPEYILCKDTKTISLANLTMSPLIATQHWEVVDKNGTSLYTSELQKITYDFPDTGTYTIKLVVNRGIECADSTTAIARVYPGFIPDFNWKTTCYKKPTNFINATTSVYGVVNSWSWQFEDDAALSLSSVKDPVFTFASVGTKNVRLIAGNSLGCKDTVSKTVTIFDKPPIELAFDDTLICLKDVIQLQAGGKGNFSWTPSIGIVDAGTSKPTVSPTATTTYFVDLDDDGCLNRDSVKVRVTDHVSLQVQSDTTICIGDTVRLRVVSDGFKFLWSPATEVLDPAVKNPLVVTKTTTSYQVIASIGACKVSGNVTVTSVPYPVAFAGNDTTVCYNAPAQLHAVLNGISFNWSPAATLTNANSLDPVAWPVKTTSYILTTFDNKGCPKAGTDTIRVVVLPPLHPFAGNDTAVVINQPLQLHGTGGLNYAWSPSTGLSSTNIADPVALYYEPYEKIRYKLLVSNQANCTDSAYIQVKVFKTLPSVFVPNAFSPNGDGNNDLLKPIVVGMQRLEYFNVYNRWGQLVFSTAMVNRGWDGTVSGKQQEAGVFIWTVRAIDYGGKTYSQKGTVLLVR